MYVSEKSGNDQNNGTEINSPFKTADKAFDYCISSNSDTVFFMEGNYIITKSLNIDKTLLIKGIPGKTYIYDKTENISSSFHISDSSFILKDLIFISENYKNNYIYSDNSLLVLDNSSFNVSCGNFISQDSGNLIIEESDISVYTAFSSEPFNFKNSIFTISGSSINFSSAVNLKGFTTESCTGLIRNTSFSLKCSDLVFYKALNSILKTDNIRFRSVSVNKSEIFKAADSRIRLNNSFFSNAESAFISDFIISEKSEINVTGTSVNLNSRGKSALFNLSEGNCSLKKSLFIINNSTNHIPALKSDNSMFYIEDCDFTLENSIKGGFIKSSDSIFELYSSAVTDLSDKNLYLMDYSGRGSVIIKNNRFNRDDNIIISETGISVLKE